jgi:diaminopimelate epimerase
MAAATWLVRETPGTETALLLEVSGAADPVPCTVRRTADGFEGTVEMPGVPTVKEETLLGVLFTVVRLEGIVHLICEGRIFQPEEAETLLRQIAGTLPDEAVGLIQWNRKTRRMIPLVYVRGSGSMVWEHGCGSGSAAVGALEAVRNGGRETAVSVDQPGGTIRVTAAAESGKILSVSIAGRIRIGTEASISIG